MPQETVLQDILETVTFLRDHGASKEDLAELEKRMASKEDLAVLEERVDKKLTGMQQEMTDMKQELQHDMTDMKQEILNSIDAFAVSQKKFDEELAAVQSNHDRVVDQVAQIAKHLDFRFREA